MNCDDFEFNFTNVDFNELKIINNLNDYNYYVSDNCDMDIDFNLYTVVIGHFSRNKIVDTVAYKMSTLPCSSNDDYYLNIVVKEKEELNTNDISIIENEYVLVFSKFDDKPIQLYYTITDI
ncbi:hypothetical protein [uncultured Polaribacter sp.]|uniref:hypothetical protein n=1 Tax=uncultured Polaribacter sp. TaxID=174711 RepID=UPI00261E5F4C|nr:hypothetical protein [uncultured Polaribacter sp.]